MIVLVDSTATSTTQVQDICASNSTILFMFSRLSECGTLPLISILEISLVTSSLNGLTVSCIDSSGKEVATTTVYIVSDSDGE